MPTAIENHIDTLKVSLTDQYVVVTGDRPELSRFEGAVGRVKTVNMSGRALVEFDGYHKNVGWHDIDPAFLRVVEKPPEPEPTKQAAKKATKPASKVPGKAGAKGGKSAADVLAAVRGGGATKPKADAAGRKPKRVSPSAGKSTADILAAARGKSSGSSSDDAPKKPKPKTASKLKPKATSGLSTAEILAAARGKKAPAKASTEPEPSESKKALATAPKPAARKKLTAADILAIANGKQSLRREQPIAATPQENQPLADPSEAPTTALPEKPNRSRLTAKDIRDMGAKGR